MSAELGSTNCKAVSFERKMYFAKEVGINFQKKREANERLRDTERKREKEKERNKEREREREREISIISVTKP